MNFKPLGERVLVERAEDAQTTESGIIIPDSAKEKPAQGKVVAVGSEVKDISTGDMVVFGKYGGNDIKLDGADYVILECDDIFGIIG